MHYGDIDIMIPMTYAALEESRWQGLPPAHARFSARAAACIARGIALVAEENSKLIGWVFGSYQDNIFVEIKEAIMLSIYVSPEHRNKIYGLKLIKAFIEEAKQNNVKEILFGSTSMKTQNRRDAVSILFKRAKLEPYGIIWGVSY